MSGSSNTTSFGELSLASTQSRKRARNTNDAGTLLTDVSRLALTLAAQVRTLKAATLRTFLLPSSCSIVMAAKQAGSQFSQAAKERSGSQSLPQPHLLAFRAVLRLDLPQKP
ncbi:unnamed protein product [Polarella glacialis]|uniref:Uncharacterized protein n=1 Tax=Polarella glacialis TaxID=89957 RepID=A0A813EN04_POLGL|nr:unnamed protein product [Polarella glacialis]